MWIFLFLGLAIGLTEPLAAEVKRLPLQKGEFTLRSPESYEQGYRWDPKMNDFVRYDPRPRVVLIDSKSGKYALEWIGQDGKELSVIFQRHDAIDAIVSAEVSQARAENYYVYIYTIHNLPSSGQHLSQFCPQNYASDVEPVKTGHQYIGKMNPSIPEFKEGNWISFGSDVFDRTFTPGRKAQVKLKSSAPPGLVECRVAGGDFGIKGVGEDLPQELANILPKYEDWSRGYTLGPVEQLKTFSRAQYAQYISERLPHLQRLGWLAVEALPWYKQNLQRPRLEEAYQRANQDLKTGQITTEVLALIEAAMRTK